MQVLGVAGSLRRDSHNRKLLRAAAAHLPPGVQFTEYDRLKLIPPFDRELPLAAAHEAFNDDGTLKDHDLTLELDAILAELLDTTRQRLAA